MNHLERFRAVMSFQPVDRLPRWEWAMWWDQTIARWHNEGPPRALKFSQVFDIAEDMSYNHGLMIAKATFDEFVAPYYRELLPRLQERHVPLLMDTDGDVTLLVPWLNELGVNGVLPLERQSSVDGLKLRQQFPRLLMVGHFDKMVMNRGEAAMRGEFERLAPLMQRGGFIPSVDHQTPPGVSLEAYRSYLRLLEEYTT
jgi:uroporphyrinogen-III decarboxylase